eukprot:7391363-Prymnesium_polylepis.2
MPPFSWCNSAHAAELLIASLCASGETAETEPSTIGMASTVAAKWVRRPAELNSGLSVSIFVNGVPVAV